jgi:hypothetical protein
VAIGTIGSRSREPKNVLIDHNAIRGGAQMFRACFRSITAIGVCAALAR